LIAEKNTIHSSQLPLDKMVQFGVSQQQQTELEVAQAEAPEFENVTWYSDPGLRVLYFWCAVLCVASATTGYDGYDYLHV
jgi:hypothetical protein